MLLVWLVSGASSPLLLGLRSLSSGWMKNSCCSAIGDGLSFTWFRRSHRELMRYGSCLLLWCGCPGLLVHSLSPFDSWMYWSWVKSVCYPWCKTAYLYSLISLVIICFIFDLIFPFDWIAFDSLMIIDLMNIRLPMNFDEISRRFCQLHLGIWCEGLSHFGLVDLQSSCIILLGQLVLFAVLLCFCQLRWAWNF